MDSGQAAVRLPGFQHRELSTNCSIDSTISMVLYIGPGRGAHAVHNPPRSLYQSDGRVLYAFPLHKEWQAFFLDGDESRPFGGRCANDSQTFFCIAHGAHRIIPSFIIINDPSIARIYPETRCLIRCTPARIARAAVPLPSRARWSYLSYSILSQSRANPESIRSHLTTNPISMLHTQYVPFLVPHLGI